MNRYISQSCCPWNAPKFIQITPERDYRPEWRQAPDRPDTMLELPGTESPSLIGLMRMTREEWDRWTRGSAMRRAGYAGFKRNVAVALGNWGSQEAVAVLAAALQEDEPLVRGHAAWALGRIGCREAREALMGALADERDAHVRREIERALA